MLIEAANKARLSDIRLSGRNFSPCQGFNGTRLSQRPPRLRSMKTFRILIVEDEPWVAMDLETIIIEFVTATVVVERSIAGSPQDRLPFELRSVPFIPKPFDAAQIESALQAVLN